MILHLIFSPSTQSLQQAMELSMPVDRFVLLGDGVTVTHASAVAHRGYYRPIEVDQRGLAHAECWQALTAISDEQWVELTLSATQVVSWS
ncbi:MAG: hypothetical protein IBX52_08025 [Bacterioplanes sp.]|nr:hypothetical protein [Bacterioplanes sp.]